MKKPIFKQDILFIDKELGKQIESINVYYLIKGIKC
jgi:hypothetical protein